MPAWTNNPFWNPTSIYGGQNIQTGAPMDWYNTPLSTQADMPYGEWERSLTNQGFGGFGRSDLLARNLYNRSQSGFESAQLSNPAITYREYLGQLGNGYFQEAINSMTPEMRGDSMPGQTRRISWG
jgi:hypothetical protein